MHVSSISPHGIVTNLNLALLPAWRLEIISSGDENGLSSQLGVGIRYVIPPTTTFAFIASIEMRVPIDVSKQISTKGLTRGIRLRDKEVFVESLQMVNNVEGLKAKDVDEIMKTAPSLVDVYYSALEAFQTGKEKHGSFIDWRWQIRPQMVGLSFGDREEKAETTVNVIEKNKSADTASDQENQS